MMASLSHPSVRVKGTENNYEPMVCVDADCSMHHSLAPHLHCPFCSKTEIYQDPVILKAHYRVKHVDKGIEFAGLKVLRCCNNCDIVGSIKGTKEFKGAHWHCYRCRNGFNRRDEALKHYKTHFRNPQTTFQIQLSEDVNQILLSECSKDILVETSEATETINAENIVTILHPSADEDIDNIEKTVQSGEEGNGVAANETVDASDATHTIMIIAEDNGLEQDDCEQPTLVYLDSKENNEEIKISMEQQQIKNLSTQLHLLEKEKSQSEEMYKEQIEHLKIQVQLQAEELAACNRREEVLLQQISVPLSDKLQDLLASLKCQHENLLHQQLAQLKRTYLLQVDNRNGQPDDDDTLDNRTVNISQNGQADNLDTDAGQAIGIDTDNRVFYIANISQNDSKLTSQSVTSNLSTSLSKTQIVNIVSSAEHANLEHHVDNIQYIKTEELEHSLADHSPTMVFSTNFESLDDDVEDCKRKCSDQSEKLSIKKKRTS